MSTVASADTADTPTRLRMPSRRPKATSKVASKVESKAPLCVPSNLMVRELANRMIDGGTEAAFVLDSKGSLNGFVTELDIVRGVAAKGWMSSFLQVSKVMTVNPKAVRLEDEAAVGLGEMVEMNLKHIPVVDSLSMPAGVLSITGSLREAFRRLKETSIDGGEKAPFSGGENSDGASLMPQVERSGVWESWVKKAEGLGESLKILLGTPRDRAKSEPTLKGILSEKVQPFVDIDKTVTSAAGAIVETKKAVVVVSGGHFIGIITPRDIIERVVAKGLNPCETVVSAVMTPRADALSAGMKIVDALIEMHNRQYTPLPVLDDAAVIGVVDVMEIIQAVAAATRQSRWEAFFVGVTASSVENPPISSLTMKSPIYLSDDLSVTQVAEQMVTAGTDVAVMKGPQDDITGILTDQEVARRFFGDDSLDPALIQANSVMTRQPTWMMGGDGVLDALAVMIEGNFRHLPVSDGVCGLSGLLGIFGCLNEVISRLEDKVQIGETEQEPILRDIMAEQSRVFFEEQDSVATAGKEVATTRKAVLVMNEARLVGVVTPKDLMRVVFKGMDAGTTRLKDVMMPAPDIVMSDTTVVEAIKKMRDNEVLYLPVSDRNSGEVSGVVEVMEILRAIASERGGERWKDFFGNEMDSADSLCDSAFLNSLEGKVVPSEYHRGPKVGVTKGMPGWSKMSRQNDKPVSSLDLKQPIVTLCNRNVFQVAKEMWHKKVYTALLTKRGRLVGIVTAGDLTRRVIALDKPPNRTAVGDVMTPRPVVVTLDDSAIEALELMLQNEIRYLPVVDEHVRIVGLLDMMTCVRHAIDRLIKNGQEILEVTSFRMSRSKYNYKTSFQKRMELALSDTLASQNMDDLIFSRGEEKVEHVKPSNKVKDAATLIAQGKKPFAIVMIRELPLDVVTVEKFARFIAEKHDPTAFSVKQVATRVPYSLGRSMTTTEALQQMCNHGKSIMGVIHRETETLMGVVDMMEILRAIVGEEGSSRWEAFFGSAMDGEDDVAESSYASLPPGQAYPTASASRRDDECPVDAEVPRMWRSPEREAVSRVGANAEAPAGFGGGNISIKVEDEVGRVHKISVSAGSLGSVRQAVAERTGIPSDAMRLTYKDERGDTIILESDDTLHVAVDLAKASNSRSLKLAASRILPVSRKDTDRETSLPLSTIGVSAGVVAGVSLVAAMLVSAAKR